MLLDSTEAVSFGAAGWILIQGLLVVTVGMVVKSIGVRANLSTSACSCDMMVEKHPHRLKGGEHKGISKEGNSWPPIPGERGAPTWDTELSSGYLNLNDFIP